jgi:tetratricopeptide (TPR) repeat protein
MPNLYRTQQTEHTIQPDTIPDQIRQEFFVAKNYVENGDYDEAIVSYKKIISLNLKIDNPDKNIGFYSRLGDLYKYQNRLSDAIDAYTNAINISKRFPSESVEQGIYINRIKCLLESSSPDNLNIVIDDCNNLIEINKNNGYSQKNLAVYVDLGKAYFKLDKIDSAIDSYKEASSLASGEKAIGAYVELGNLYELQGNDDIAVSCYTSGINSSDNLKKTIAPHIRLANLYRKQGRFTEAESIYNKIISSRSIPDKKKLGAYNNLGKLYENLRRNKDALNFYERAIRTAPENTVAYVNAVLLLDKLGEVQKADVYFKFLVQSNYNLIEYLRDTQKALNIAEAE